MPCIGSKAVEVRLLSVAELTFRVADDVIHKVQKKCPEAGKRLIADTTTQVFRGSVVHIQVHARAWYIDVIPSRYCRLAVQSPSLNHQDCLP